MARDPTGVRPLMRSNAKFNGRIRRSASVAFASDYIVTTLKS